MFKIGEKVVYSSNGVCKINEITKLNLNTANKDKLYCVLENLENKGIAYIPIDSTVYLRPVMSKEETEILISKISSISISDFGVVNPKEMPKVCQETISTHDNEKIIALIKFLRTIELQKKADKKKLSATEERYLSQAIMIIGSEISCSLGISKDELKDIIFNSVEI